MPSACSVPMMATAISEARTAYSVAGEPAESRTKARRNTIMTGFRPERIGWEVLAAVVAIDADIAMGEIAGPNPCSPLGYPNINIDLYFTTLHITDH